MTRPRYTLLYPCARTAPPVLAALGVAAIGALAWPYTVDDAFITARYAQHLARGLGYAMNPPHASDGVTGPLWLVPQLLAIACGISPLAVAKALGLLCAALAAGLSAAILRARALGRTAAWVAAAACVLSPSLPSWGVAGLETGLATLLLTGAAAQATRAPRVSAIGLGLCVAALAWLRPELAFASAGLLAGATLRDRSAGRTAIAIALLGALSVTGFRLLMFGDALPLSVRAKSGSLADGLRYATTSLVLATSIVGAAIAALGVARGGYRARTLGLAIALHLGAVVLAGGDWMPGYRLLVPVLPLYAQLLAIGVTRSALRRPWLPALAVALACALPALDLLTRVPELRASASGQPEAARLARWLADHAASAALVDVGYLGYASGVEVVDLGGLTDPAIARMPGGHLHKRIDPAYLRARAPDAIVLHSRGEPRISASGELLAFDGYPVERQVAALPFVRAGYRVAARFTYNPNYRYLVLARAARDR